MDGGERLFRRRIGWPSSRTHPSPMKRGDSGSDSERMVGVVSRKDHCEAARRNPDKLP